MSNISYLNGEFIDRHAPSISLEDRGYQFSDGVYEVVYITHGVCVDWQLHCKRLQRSLDGLRIDYQVDSNALHAIAMQLLEKNHLSDAALYLQITRGVAKRNHAFPKQAVAPVLSITVDKAPTPTDEEYQQGGSAIFHEDQRWKRRDLKTISLLPNILAKQAAVEAGTIESILVEEDGAITEGSCTNFFMVDHNKNLRTHPANERILGGITRDGVLKVANRLELKVVEQPFTKAEVLNAAEAFITSTTKHIYPITCIEGQTIANGTPQPITQQLMAAYQDYIKEQLT